MRALTGLILAFALAGTAQAAEIRVMESGAFAAPLAALVPGFEKATGDHVITIPGPSMGATPQAIPNRLARGEAADVVILARSSLDDLVAKGEVAAGSQADLVRSKIAMAVKAGAPRPDISTVDAFRRALLAAKSVAYSDSASGVYIQTQMFKNLGIDAQMKPKSHMIPATPVGEAVARGDVELGFQQFSELKPVPGIDIVGVIPDGVQSVTVFSAGVASGAKAPKAARALIAYLASKGVNPIVVAAGLEPVNPPIP